MKEITFSSVYNPRLGIVRIFALVPTPEGAVVSAIPRLVGTVGKNGFVESESSISPPVDLVKDALDDLSKPPGGQ